MKDHYKIFAAGTLILAVFISAEAKALVDRNGSKKQFGVFTDAMNWCYTDTKGAP